MRILYDVSSLGRGFGSELTRSGIFRVTREFVDEVRRRQDLSVHFAALPSLLDEVQLARYDRSHGAELERAIVTSWNPGEPLEACIELVDVLDAEPTARGARLAKARVQLLNASARPLAVPEPYDIYHSLRPPLANASRVRSAVRVVTVHDAIPALFPELCDDSFVPAFEKVIASVDPQRDFVVCHSTSTRDDLTSVTSIPEERIFVVPPAASRSTFFPQADDDVVASTLARHGIRDLGYVLSLGTLEPRKNLAELVRAFRELVATAPFEETALVLAGATGWKSDPIFEAVSAGRAAGARIVLPGHVPDADLAALYRGAALFVFPSMYEGFGLPVLEAMQCGTPVVTTNVSSLPEVAGTAALTVEPTERALLDAMRRVLGDPQLGLDLSREGLERASRFSWEKTVEQTVAAYRQMLDSTVRRPPNAST